MHGFRFAHVGPIIAVVSEHKRRAWSADFAGEALRSHLLVWVEFHGRGPREIPDGDTNWFKSMSRNRCRRLLRGAISARLRSRRRKQDQMQWI